MILGEPSSDGVRRLSEWIRIGPLGPGMRARDRQAEVSEDTARLGGIATGHIDRLDAEEARLGDGGQRRRIETHPCAAEADRIAEGIELDGER